MLLARTYTSRKDIPRGAEELYVPTGNLFILKGTHDVGSAKRDFVTDNPWEPATWNLTAQGRFISEYGMIYATAFAKMANSAIGATKPRSLYQPDLRVLVQRRDLTTNVTNVTVEGGGTSGEGPPS